MKIDFGGMFFHAPGSNIPSEKLLKDMTIPDTYFVRQFPYHFKDNLKFSDDDAVLESLKEFKRVGRFSCKSAFRVKTTMTFFV